MRIMLLIVSCVITININIKGQNDRYSFNSKLIEEYETFVKNRIKKDSLVGVGIALILDDSVIWKKGYGYADKEKNIPFTTKTTLCIGSVTKSITALGIMQLQEKGLIDIDKPLVDYLPQFSLHTRKDNIRDITVRSVINHSSGIPNDIFVYNENDKYTSTVDYLKNEYLSYSPNLVFHYSNVGYTLLGHTIFNISEENYPDYIHKNILCPVGMNNSGFIKYRKLSNVGKTYDKSGKYHSLKEGRNLPAGSLYSNIDDMVMLAQEIIAIYHGKQGSFLNPVTLYESFSVQGKKAILDNINRGIAWSVLKNDSCMAIVSTGSNHVSNAGIVIVPEKKMAAIFQINTVGGLALAIDGIDKFLETVGLEQNDIFSQNIIRERNVEPVNLPMDSLKMHIGLYPNTRSVIQVIPKNGKLNLTANFGNYILYSLTKNEFNFGKIHSSDSIQLFPNNRFIFKDIDHRHFLFWEDESYRLHNLSFLIQPQTINDLWKERLGTYKVISKTIDAYDMFSEVELLISENNLIQLRIAYTSGKYEYNMYVESDRELVFCGFGECGGETVSFIEDNQTDLMTLFGLTLKKID